jgi:hypothetical protein
MVVFDWVIYSMGQWWRMKVRRIRRVCIGFSSQETCRYDDEDEDADRCRHGVEVVGGCGLWEGRGRWQVVAMG